MSDALVEHLMNTGPTGIFVAFLMVMFLKPPKWFNDWMKARIAAQGEQARLIAALDKRMDVHHKDLSLLLGHMAAELRLLRKLLQAHGIKIEDKITGDVQT